MSDDIWTRLKALLRMERDEPGDVGTEELGSLQPSTDGGTSVGLYECPTCEVTYVSEGMASCPDCGEGVARIANERELGFG